MVRKVAAVLLGTMIGSSLYAGNYDENTKGFLGVEAGYGTVDGDRADGLKHKGNAAEYGLRFGAQSDEWRATFALDYFNSNKDDQKAEKGYLMVDYFFLGSDSDITVQPFIGANAGIMRYESTLVDSTNFLYGGQAGIVVGVNENVDLDLSYRYSFSAATSVNSAGSIVFGLNYLY